MKGSFPRIMPHAMYIASMAENREFTRPVAIRVRKPLLISKINLHTVPPRQRRLEQNEESNIPIISPPNTAI